MGFPMTQGSMRIVLPPGVSIRKAAWPNHVILTPSKLIFISNSFSLLAYTAPFYDGRNNGGVFCENVGATSVLNVSIESLPYDNSTNRLAIESAIHTRTDCLPG